MTKTLSVFLDGAPVGTLVQTPQGDLKFEYEESYQNDDDATPLSLSMPLTRRSHPNRVTRAFLQGLLPDSEGRLKEIGSEHHVSPNNPFALLEHVGRDAAGAVQILPPEEASTDAAERQGNVQILSATDFAALVADIIANRETWGRRDTANGKWSLPGAQPKVALFRADGGQWAVPLDSTPTTHIVKPAVPPYSDHHINEFMTMAAARHLGIHAARDFILTTERGDAAFVSERYDRVRDDTRWVRLHQEDLCQALGYPPSKKYQSENGPGVSNVSTLFKALPAREDQLLNAERFFDALTFNLAMQGTDAHAKNYSLMLSGERATLAPLYDLASHAPYPSKAGQTMKMAMSIEGEYRMNAIGVSALVRAAKKLGLEADVARARAQFITGNVVAAYGAAADDARSNIGSHPFISTMTDSIAAYTAARGWDQEASGSLA